MTNKVTEKDFYLIFLNFLKRTPNGLSMEELSTYSFAYLIEKGHLTEEDANRSHQLCLNVASHRKGGIFQEFPMIEDKMMDGKKNRLTFHATEFGLEFLEDNKNVLEVLTDGTYFEYQQAVSQTFGIYKNKYNDIVAQRGIDLGPRDEVEAVGVNSPVAEIVVEPYSQKVSTQYQSRGGNNFIVEYYSTDQGMVTVETSLNRR